MELRPETVAPRLKDLQENREYHATAIQKVIDEQMDATVAQQMNAGGGGRAVLDSALNLLRRVCPHENFGMANLSSPNRGRCTGRWFSPLRSWRTRRRPRSTRSIPSFGRLCGAASSIATPTGGTVQPGSGTRRHPAGGRSGRLHHWLLRAVSASPRHPGADRGHLLHQPSP